MKHWAIAVLLKEVDEPSLDFELSDACIRILAREKVLSVFTTWITITVSAKMNDGRLSTRGTH